VRNSAHAAMVAENRRWAAHCRPRYALAVNGETPTQSRRTNSARRDLIIVMLIACAAVIISVKFDVSEALTEWSRPLEWLQVDELPGVLLVIALSLIWFSGRRYSEASRELSLRRAAETKLAETLAQNQHLALSYVDLQERERKTLAHDLHDELGQYVNALKLDAVVVRDASPRHTPAHASALAMIINIDRIYSVLRGLIRRLRPVGFDDLGVIAALEHCLNEWRPRLPATDIELSCAPELESLDEARRLVVFRLVQEAMTNVACHSAATRVRIQIDHMAKGIEIVIADNGTGADLEAPRSGLGLIGMRERVAALGGSVRVVSSPDAGFTVLAFVPLQNLSVSERE
jgi:two-component system, NarL family, sensor histidine kinase UhpB